MRLTREDVYHTLESVLDPELNIDVVSLGLIYSVDISESGEKTDIKIKMTLTTPGCPLGSTIVRMIRDALAVYPFLNPEKDVGVEIVFDPPWTQDMMNEEAKAQLGF